MGEAAVLVLCHLQDVCLEGRMGLDMRAGGPSTWTILDGIVAGEERKLSAIQLD